MYDKYKTYNGAFLLAGVPPLIGGAFLSAIRCVPSKIRDKEGNVLEEPEQNLSSELLENGGKKILDDKTNEKSPLLYSKFILTKYSP